MFNVKNEVHTAIKIRAASRNETMTEYILWAISEKITKESRESEEK